MGDRIVSFAAALARLWTCCYTYDMPPALRNARRAEIDSDLWEFEDDARQHGDGPVIIAAHILVRLSLGLVDDLSWRFERAEGRSALRRTSWWFAAGTLGLLVVTLWLFAPLLAGPGVPSPPKPPNLNFRASPPPPPPPPPPPVGATSK
jgi:hypothetical protein